MKDLSLSARGVNFSHPIIIRYKLSFSLFVGSTHNRTNAQKGTNKCSASGL